MLMKKKKLICNVYVFPFRVITALGKTPTKKNKIIDPFYKSV